MNKSDTYQNALSEKEQAFAAQLQHEAEAAPPADNGLAIHFTAIQTLRAKGYSYRAISDWFSQRGLKVNHVEVWRAHKNGMKKDELFNALEHDEDWDEFVEKRQEGNTTTYTDKDQTTAPPQAAKKRRSQPERER